MALAASSQRTPLRSRPFRPQSVGSAFARHGSVPPRLSGLEPPLHWTRSIARTCVPLLWICCSLSGLSTAIQKGWSGATNICTVQTTDEDHWPRQRPWQRRLRRLLAHTAKLLYFTAIKFHINFVWKFSVKHLTSSVIAFGYVLITVACSATVWL